MNCAERRALYIQYMRAKIEEADWHGVSDAANDLRELEAKYEKAPAIELRLRDPQGFSQESEDERPLSATCNRGPPPPRSGISTCAYCGFENCKCQSTNAR